MSLIERLDTIEKVRAYIVERRAELIEERKQYRAEGDTMQAYEVTGCALELGDLLAKIPEEPALNHTQGDGRDA